ncbi:DKNYY domain-containing protein [Flavobacterium sp. I3-2]|uniref:DKNYY domain-containing protein n=1 Tax=Flavobacterium sp. I3-2 TaxID=2748319 RepID=UPI0015B2D9C2|nr:DKNYY domain-containing protein [Flavobacterium sp. I3-2]
MKKIIQTMTLLFVIMFSVSCAKKQDLGNDYFKENKKIVYKYASSGASWPKVPWDNKYRDVENADVESFQSLEPYYGYAKDKNNFYYKGYKIDNIDYETFTISGNKHDGIVKDKNHVYEFSKPGIPIQNVDGATYEEVKFPNSSKIWYKDKNHYFFKNKPIQVDVNTFTAINENIYVDQNHIYFFKTNGNFDIYEDKNILNQEIKDTARTIQTANYLYTLTKEAKFKRIPKNKNSKVQYFAPNNVFIIVDNQVYCNGEEMNIDFNTFEFYNYPNSNSPTCFSKDKNNVYYYDQILAGANPKTAKLTDDNYIVDGDFKWIPDYNSAHHSIRKMRIDEKL